MSRTAVVKDKKIVVPDPNEPWTIEKCLEHNKKVYVKNQLPGIFCASVADPITGKSRELKIPRTWIPICLNDSLSVNCIENSTDLKMAILTGAIEIIDPYAAEKVLREPDAQEEKDRLYKSSHLSIKRLSALVNKPATEEAQNTPKEQYVPTVEDSINQRVVSLVVCVGEKTMTIKDALSELRCLGNLNETDYVYIVDNCEDNKFKQYAQKELAILRGLIK